MGTFERQYVVGDDVYQLYMQYESGTLVCYQLVSLDGRDVGELLAAVPDEADVAALVASDEVRRSDATRRR